MLTRSQIAKSALFILGSLSFHQQTASLSTGRKIGLGLASSTIVGGLGNFYLAEITSTTSLNKIATKNNATQAKDISIKDRQEIDSQEFIKAVESYDEKKIKKILQQGQDLNQRLHNGTPSLISVVGHGDIRLFELFLEQQNIDINAQSKFGNAALHIACNNGQNDIAKLLLQNGANPNIKNSEGRNPIMAAAQGNNVEMLDLILNKDPSLVDEQDINGDTALSLAVFDGNIETVKVLLKYNPNLNVENSLGTTPLKSALLKDRPDLFKMLLDAGADPEYKNQYQSSVIDEILTCENDEFLKLTPKIKIADEISKLTQKYLGSKEYRGKKQMLEAIEEINLGLTKISAKGFQIFDAGIFKHRAFFVIEHDKNANPKKIYYVDGSLPQNFYQGEKEKFGVIYWEIDQQKLQQSNIDLANYLKQATKKPPSPEIQSQEEFARESIQYLVKQINEIATNQAQG